MEYLNKVELVGIVGSVHKPFAGCVRFSVATNSVFRSKGGDVVVETTWHNVVMWGNAELEKGNNVHITGRIKNQSYIAADGERRYQTEIVASNVEIIREKLTLATY